MAESSRDFVWINGSLQPAAEARIAPNDRGFLLGDGLFETMLAVDGHVPLLQRHLARVTSSAEALGIPMPYAPAALNDALAHLLNVNAMDKGRAALRLSLSRGTGPRGLLPSPDAKPSVLISSAPHPGPKPFAVGDGLGLHLADLRVNASSPLRRHKTLSYLENVLARREAEAQGADEALLMNTELRIAEASAANLFAVVEDALWTPAISEGALPGVTRGLVLELAEAAGIATHEGRLGLAELASASEVFLTSSLMGLRPVTSLGGLPQMGDLHWPAEELVVSKIRGRWLEAMGLR